MVKHVTYGTRKKLHGSMLFFTCTLWLAATLFILNLETDSGSDTRTALALNQPEALVTAPLRQQSTPANAPMRVIAVEVHHQKIKFTWLVGGDTALPTVVLIRRELPIGQALASSQAASNDDRSVIAPSARAPPAFA